MERRGTVGSKIVYDGIVEQASVDVGEFAGERGGAVEPLLGVEIELGIVAPQGFDS
jgi:hypothetical protein